VTAGGYVFVLVDNLTGNAVAMVASEIRTCVRIDKGRHERRPVSVVALEAFEPPGQAGLNF
jgi:hypothetical protein